MTTMSETDLLTLISREIAEISLGRLRAEDVGGDANMLSELGLDSLDYASVVVAAERAAGVRVLDLSIDWAAVRTPRQLAAVFASASH